MFDYEVLRQLVCLCLLLSPMAEACEFIQQIVLLGFFGFPRICAYELLQRVACLGLLGVPTSLSEQLVISVVGWFLNSFPESWVVFPGWLLMKINQESKRVWGATANTHIYIYIYEYKCILCICRLILRLN